MARKVTLVDDLDGSSIEDGQGATVTFALRGQHFEIDLTDKNQAKLEKALQPFIDVAQKVSAPSAMAGRPAVRTMRTQVPGKGHDYLEAVRRWARDNGHQVADRGRVAQSIQDAYEAAQQGGAPAKATTRASQPAPAGGFEAPQ